MELKFLVSVAILTFNNALHRMSSSYNGILSLVSVLFSVEVRCVLISGLNCSITVTGARGHVSRVQQGGSSVSGLIWRVISWRPDRLDS